MPFRVIPVVACCFGVSPSPCLLCSVISQLVSACDLSLCIILIQGRWQSRTWKALPCLGHKPCSPADGSGGWMCSYRVWLQEGSADTRLCCCLSSGLTCNQASWLALKQGKGGSACVPLSGTGKMLLACTIERATPATCHRLRRHCILQGSESGKEKEENSCPRWRWGLSFELSSC